MEPKDITIQCPEGYEYYIENNTIKFKRKEVTWEDIKAYLSSSMSGMLLSMASDLNPYMERNYLRVALYSKLYCIAKYYNGDWHPKKPSDTVYNIAQDSDGNIFFGSWSYSSLPSGAIFFKDKASARTALELMGDYMKYLF